MSYAQARLRLGICGVGWWVLVACLGLSSPLTSRLTVGETALVYGLASLPFDLLGGQLLPWLWGQARLAPGHWLITYVRAVALHQSLWCVSLATCLTSYRVCGLSLTILLFWALSLAFFAYQLPLLSWLGVKIRKHSWGWEAAAADTRFAGGLWGIPWPGRERIVIPSRWLSAEAPAGLEQAIERRRNLSRSASRAAGLLGALTFNTIVLSQALQWGQGNPANTACWATLLSFLGLLLLPSLSRQGVMAADQSPPLKHQWFHWMEELQEEDFYRSQWVDRIFHPVPQGAQRQRAAARPGRKGLVPWNLARYALVHSLLCGSLLSRAVHCNCGRPELWFWPPGD